MTEYIWRGIEVESLERARVEGSRPIAVQSVVDSARGRYSYELELDDGWVFRSLRLESATEQRALEVTREPSGEWSVDGIHRGDLVDAVDIDLPVTPLTNSLPIRRLDLAVGDEADLVVAYVVLPELAVVAETQRYTRLDEDLYLFESLDDDFSREITVDAAGIVLEYPGLFERL